MFTIIVGDDGYYYYAVAAKDDQIVASSHRADGINAKSLGLERTLISPAEYRRRVQEFNSFTVRTEKAPSFGKIINLVVYIRG
jgi:hypothetical protein